jgi:hypothetical protein
LHRKGDTVTYEPAACEWLDQPVERLKAFQKPNPSVSIVNVNTDRILRPPQDEIPTGATVRPHDRRAHYRRVGRKLIQIKATKIHGGAPTPTAKVVKLERALA